MHLEQIEQRIENMKIPLDRSVSEVFCKILSSLKEDSSVNNVLSVSTGDGIWDYLAFSNTGGGY